MTGPGGGGGFTHVGTSPTVRLWKPPPRLQVGHPLAQGLIGAWNFQDGDNSPVVRDSSSHGNTGTIIAASDPWAGGFSGWSFSTNSTNYITIPDAPVLDSPKSVTIAAWFRSTGTPAEGSTIAAKINSSWETFGLYQDPLFFGVNGLAFTLSTTLNATAEVSANDGRLYTDGEWHQATGIYDAFSGMAYLWVDGVRVAAQHIGGDLVYDNSDFAIGAYSGAYHFYGNLDGVLLYNRALTPSEVTALFHDTWQMYREQPVWLFAPPVYTMSGEVLGSGIASCNIGYNPAIASAGLVASGNARTTAIYKPSTTGAGLLAGTSAGYGIDYPNINGAGGVLLNGAASINVVCHPHIASAGDVCSGSATCQFTANITSSGGALVNGYVYGNFGQKYDECMSGGVEGSLRTGPVNIICNVVASGGVMAGGAAPMNEVSTPALISQGVMVSGSGPIHLFVLGPTYAPAGVWAAGDSYYESHFIDGGVLLGTAGSVLFEFNIRPSGGGWLAGHGAMTFDDAGSGGARINFRPSGGPRIYIANVVASETGVLAGGGAPVNETFNSDFDPAGVMVKGMAGVGITFPTVVGSGSGYAQGSATLGIVVNEATSGGSVLAGAAAASVITRRSTSGGTRCGGKAVAADHILVVPAGGSVCGGTAVFHYTAIDTPTGGLVASSTAPVQQAIPNPLAAPAGICGAGGGAYFSFFQMAAGGGVCVGSAGVVLWQFNILPSDGAWLAGHGSTIFNMVGSGGVLGSGLYVGQYHNIEVQSAGALVAGEPFLETVAYFVQADCVADPSSMKCGYSNDNQFCANAQPIQGFGSKFFNGKQRTNPALPRLNRGVQQVGSTALVPAITFCRQKIRTRPSDFPPPTILSVGPNPSTQELRQMSMMAAQAVPRFDEPASQEADPAPSELGEGEQKLSLLEQLRRTPRNRQGTATAL